MAREIKIAAILAPRGIYQRQAVPAEGYAPSAKARFGVLRTSAKTPWLLVHLPSGASIDSILPATKSALTMREKLAVCAAWEAHTHLDWSAFDALPLVSLDTVDAPAFALLNASQRDTLDEMRQIAARVLLGA